MQSDWYIQYTKYGVLQIHAAFLKTLVSVDPWIKSRICRWEKVSMCGVGSDQ